MRPIKFRIWTKTGEPLILEPNWLGDYHWGIGKGMDLGEDPPKEMEQFTGLTDKNGVEIYEGDILRRTYKTKYYIGRDIRNGKDVGARYSDEKEEFYSIYEVLWFNGTYEVNCSEYSILVNGWAVRYVFNNQHLKEQVPPYGFGEIKPLGLPFESENCGAYGLVANSCEIVGNIRQNPDLLS